ncbi:hypothetical protein B0H16DRAFT_1500597 [Mycena metata]|uniref:TLC domain-containing protein n=1 Tax=Mycena metata TaxID=1033252 RepID=A0AAD7K7Y0_9AGAR|nr:hypothetical protein B0H16DRAFT_1500597 [Mycena metata]
MSAAAPPVFSAPTLVNLSDFTLSLSTTPVFLPAFLTLCASYPAISPFFPSTRQRAWILTTIASAVMTLASLPFVRDYTLALRAGGGVADVQLRTPAAVAVNRDMFMGGMYYRDQIGVLAGWMHHTVYVGITEIAIRSAWAHIFCFAACMELPTLFLLLGLATLLPPLRSNALFALTFLLTRILLHLVLHLSYAAAPATRVPAGILALVFPLHMMWFAGCVRGFVRRFKKGVAAKAAARHPLAPDVYPDARSLARHSALTSSNSSSTIPPPEWGGVTLRLRRLRARRLPYGPPGWLPSHSFTHRLAFLSRALRHSNNVWRPQRPILRAVRPRVMVRRMSASLIKALALPSREVVLDYVLGESGRRGVPSHLDPPPTSHDGGRVVGEEVHPDPVPPIAGVEVEVGAS